MGNQAVDTGKLAGSHANLIEELPKAALGNTGLNVSRLSFGTGSNGWQGRSNQSELGIDQLASLLKFGYAHAAIRYALNFGTIHAITIGVKNQNQLMENIRFVRGFLEKQVEMKA